MKCKSRTHFALSVLLLLATCNAFATGHLKITLSQPGNKAEAEAGIVTVTFENTGDQPVSLLRWKTPFAVNDNRLANPQFTVFDSQHNELPYVGRNVKFVGISSSSFIVLQPHQILSKNVDVGSDYDLKDGQYTMRYVLDLSPRPETNQSTDPGVNDIPVNAQKEALSNDLTIWVTPSLISANRLKLALADASTQQSYVCTNP